MRHCRAHLQLAKPEKGLIYAAEVAGHARLY